MTVVMIYKHINKYGCYQLKLFFQHGHMDKTSSGFNPQHLLLLGDFGYTVCTILTQPPKMYLIIPNYFQNPREAILHKKAPFCLVCLHFGQLFPPVAQEALLLLLVWYTSACHLTKELIHK